MSLLFVDQDILILHLKQLSSFWGVLYRSLGGWTEVKKGRLKGCDHVMSDERILGDSDFVDSVISQFEEQYERRHKLIVRRK